MRFLSHSLSVTSLLCH